VHAGLLQKILIDKWENEKRGIFTRISIRVGAILYLVAAWKGFWRPLSIQMHELGPRTMFSKCWRGCHQPMLL